MQVREFAARYWPSIVPATFIAVLSVILPADWNPFVRVAAAVGILLLGVGLRASQDWATEHQTKRRDLFQRLFMIVKDFEFFFRASPSHVRDVSAFQAAAALYNQNTQVLADWFFGIEQSRTMLDRWLHHLLKRLELMESERRFSDGQLGAVFNEVSELAIAYQEEIGALRQRWERPGLTQHSSASELFDRFYPEYNTWLLQFRTLRDEAAKTLATKLNTYALMQQAPLSAARAPQAAAVSTAEAVS